MKLILHRSGNSMGEPGDSTYIPSASSSSSTTTTSTSGSTYQKVTATLTGKSVVATLKGKKITVKSTGNVGIYIPITGSTNSYYWTAIPKSTYLGIATGNMAKIGTSSMLELTATFGGASYKIWTDAYRVDSSDVAATTTATTTINTSIIDVPSTAVTTIPTTTEIKANEVATNATGGEFEKYKKPAMIVGGILLFVGGAIVVKKVFFSKPKVQKSENVPAQQ